MICFYIFTQVIDHQQKLCGIVIHRWHAPIVGKTWFIQKSSWVRTKWGENISQEVGIMIFLHQSFTKHVFSFHIAFIEWIFGWASVTIWPGGLNTYITQVRRFMYQNLSERYLTVFCINCTANVLRLLWLHSNFTNISKNW